MRISIEIDDKKYGIDTEPEVVDKPAGDEHHTMDELYDYRMAYHALAVKYWNSQGNIFTCKSTTHSDGSEIFPESDDKWFIVESLLPTGLVSNHYKLKWWTFFDCEVVKPGDTRPRYDGHTPKIALERIKEYVYKY